jgi:hypothetical protein
MPRLLSVLTLVAGVSIAVATDPTPLEKQLTLQTAMATARQLLDVNMPADAVKTLEEELANADGNKAFLSLLREAYLAELQQLEKSSMPDMARIAQVRRKLALLGGALPTSKTEPPQPASTTTGESTLPPPVFDPPRTPKPTGGMSALPPPLADSSSIGADAAAEAAAAFKAGNYAEAARWFAKIPNLTTDQKTAWVYCRIKLSADRLNTPGCDVASVIAEVSDALKLAPHHAELQKVGQQILAIARTKSDPSRELTETSNGNWIETASFRVRHTGNRELAAAVAQAAENQRKAIFERWSGPATSPWSPKCEIIVHPTAEAFAKATSRPPQWTGNALVRLTDGRAEERRIDLRADDPSITTNALPRELTHVILADLFPTQPPPKWAAEGMAILASSPEEVSRYTRTLLRCARDGEWFSLGQLLEMNEFPTEKITAFYCQSVSLTEYLIRAAGSERNFTIFLRDCHRYGTPQALKRQMGIDSLQLLETSWKRSALEGGPKP